MLNKRLYRALLAVFGDSEPFTASDVLKRSHYVAAPKFFEMRAALKSTFGPKFGAIKIGKWLAVHCDTEAGELRLSGEYDSHNKRWNYSVFKMATIKEIETELDESAQQFVEQREKKLAGKDLGQQLKQIEKDNAKLDELDEQRRVAESDKEYQKREANAEAIPVVKKAEKRPVKNIFLAPATGFFLFEAKTEKRCRDLQALGFKANMGYLSANRFVIWIDGHPDMKELKRVALRFMLKVHESVNTPAKTKADSSETELVWDQRTETWLPKPTAAMPLGYDPAAKFLARAFTPDHERAGPAIVSHPFLKFPWDIFN